MSARCRAAQPGLRTLSDDCGTLYSSALSGKIRDSSSEATAEATSGTLEAGTSQVGKCLWRARVHLPRPSPAAPLQYASVSRISHAAVVGSMMGPV